MKFAVMTNNSSLFNLICQCFSDDRIECRRFDDDVALSRAIYRDEYHAILVDAATGIDSTRAVFARRECYGDRRAPLVVVGALADRGSIERAFEAGADDVVRAPIDRSELTARTYLALRRFQAAPAAQSGQSDDWATLGPYRLDRRTGAVLIHDRLVKLTVREFAIAWLLFSRAGEYVSRRQIAGTIWSSTEDIVGRTLEQHIYKLRKKLGLNGADGVQLRTMYAHGYRVELCEEGKAEAERGVETLVHAEDSEAARSAQPWEKHAAVNIWSLGTLQAPKIVAHFVEPSPETLETSLGTSLEAPLKTPLKTPKGSTTALPSFSFPAALLGAPLWRR
ncbi:response regulator transcription factor [Trinickia violacea]|uniref:Response regulator transcription factor n=1 Tax=Trinickia violacea TaxID=2571746 RepID=A0A4P8J1V0_9BURK|nr:response regulator transcription factor [Trinickia violacea]QCP54816.1 response regulator transcription factor [Trinickia violacea]